MKWFLRVLKEEWQILKKTPAIFYKREIILTLLPAVLWYTAVLSRPYFIDLRCSKLPKTCNQSEVFLLDRFVLNLPYSEQADRYSQWTQATSGFLAFGLPLVWHANSLLLQRVSTLTAFSFVGADFLIVAQTSLWNGLSMEGARIFFQRPRPFVYQNPFESGQSAAHYTSFWSGHTSFAAAANTAAFITLLGRGASAAALSTTACAGILLTILTGLFRVVSIRHFPSDVIVGMFAGILVSIVVAHIHRKRS